MAAIIDNLREDHRNMNRLLDKLEGEIAPMRGDSQPRLEVIQEAVSYCLTYPDLYHHPMEDLVYGRMVERGVSPAQIGDLTAAHRDLAGMTRRLSQMVKSREVADAEQREAFASLIESFVDTYRLHMNAEDKVFFPLAEEKLTSDDWAEIEQELSRMPDPMFGDRALIDYPKLHATMVSGN
ncbi:MAG: hemerythrin domain-containing protein [Pseudomonadota bacterium]